MRLGDIHDSTVTSESTFWALKGDFRNAVVLHLETICQNIPRYMFLFDRF